VLAGSGQHQYARALGGAIDDAGELGRHGVGHAVAALGMIDRDTEHGPLLFDQKIVHDGPLFGEIGRLVGCLVSRGAVWRARRAPASGLSLSQLLSQRWVAGKPMRASP